MNDQLIEVIFQTSSLVSVSVIPGLLLAIVSVIWQNNGHTLRVAGLLLVTGICFASNNWFCYTVTVFLIGTTFAEAEFLQNIAAIFNKNKEYWDYKIKSASPSEREYILEERLLEQSAGEQREEEGSEFPKVLSVKAVRKIDQSVFDALSKRFDIDIAQYTYLTLPNKNEILVDGFAQLPEEEYIIEIKQGLYLNDELSESFTNSTAEKLRQIDRVSNKRVSLFLVIVGDFGVEQKSYWNSKMKEKFIRLGVNPRRVKILIYDYKDLEIDLKDL